MTKLTIVEALETLAEICPYGYQQRIIDNANPETNISYEINTIRDAYGGNPTDRMNLTVDSTGIRKIRNDGLIETGEPVYRVLPLKTYSVRYFVKDVEKYTCDLVNVNDLPEDLYDTLNTSLPDSLFFDSTDKDQKIREMIENGDFDEHGFNTAFSIDESCSLIIQRA